MRKLENYYLLISALISFSIFFIGICYFSWQNPNIRLEHFSFLFSILGSIATALTLIYLVIQNLDASRDSKKNEEMKQASEISSWLSYDSDKHNQYTENIHILNNSKLPIYNITVSIVDGRNAESDGRNTPEEFRRHIFIAPPGESVLEAPIGYKGMGFIGSTEIAFKDAKNTYWLRKGNGRLTKMNVGLEAYYDLTLPLNLSATTNTHIKYR